MHELEILPKKAPNESSTSKQLTASFQLSYFSQWWAFAKLFTWTFQNSRNVVISFTGNLYNLQIWYFKLPNELWDDSSFLGHLRMYVGSRCQSSTSSTKSTFHPRLVIRDFDLPSSTRPNTKLNNMQTEPVHVFK